MQVLRDAPAMEHAIATWPDRAMATLLAEHLAFWREQDDIDLSEQATVILVEPGDTLHDLDAVLNGLALSNPWSGRNHGDPGYRPCFETCDEYPGFIDVMFIVGDGGFGLEVLIPTSPEVDPRILDLFQPHATPGVTP